MKKKCPPRFFCRTGTTEPKPCTMFSICPEGTIDDSQNILNYVALALVVIFIFAISFFMHLFELFNQFLRKIKIFTIIINLFKKSKKKVYENLEEISNKDKEIYKVDIGFKDLSLQIRNGDFVLNKVSGLLENKKITAVMGLSGNNYKKIIL
jgi:ABC-type transport system involved in cytochrome bd biosynthesis fused ATPase/permease subunit